MEVLPLLNIVVVAKFIVISSKRPAGSKFERLSVMSLIPSPPIPENLPVVLLYVKETVPACVILLAVIPFMVLPEPAASIPIKSLAFNVLVNPVTPVALFSTCSIVTSPVTVVTVPSVAVCSSLPVNFNDLNSVSFSIP